MEATALKRVYRSTGGAAGVKMVEDGGGPYSVKDLGEWPDG